MELNPVQASCPSQNHASSSINQSIISLTRTTPALYCEQRLFDYHPTRFLIPASSEGYLILFNNDSNLIFPLDVATDDWGVIETKGFEQLCDDAPLEGICVNAALFIIGQTSEDERKRTLSFRAGNEIKIQYLEFAKRKWRQLTNIKIHSNAELITASVINKYERTRIRIFVMCTNGQLIEAVLDPLHVLMKSIKRCTIHNVPDLLSSQGVTIGECALLKADEWRWLERKAFFDHTSNRLFWIGLSNCAYDMIHILDVQAPNQRRWQSVRIPRNDRMDIHEINFAHVSRLAYLPFHRRFVLFLSELPTYSLITKTLSSEEDLNREVPLPKTYVWAVSLAELEKGWSLISILSDLDITCVVAGDYGDLYCLNSSVFEYTHKEQNTVKLSFGVPSLKLLALHKLINSIDHKTKQLQKRYLVSQLQRFASPNDLEALWYRTKLDKGVLKQLYKGKELYGDIVDNDDKIPFLKKMARRFSKY